MAVTQKNIADNLGVSRELVKFALRGNGRMRPEVRQRIVAEAQRLGYSSLSNSNARQLAGRRNGTRVKTGILAVLMPMPLFEGIPVQEVPFFRPFLQALESEAGKREFDVFLCSVRQGHLPRLVREQGVDGVICLSMGHEDLHGLDLPLVLFGSLANWAHGLAPDDAEGTRQATQHLIELGHRHIAYVGFHRSMDYATSSARLDGYRTALERAGLPYDEELVEDSLHHPTEDAGYEGFSRLLARTQRATAVVCFNDLIAYGVVRRALAAGLQVPRDLSVVGFDDVSEHYPERLALTSVGFDRAAMGRRAVQIVEEWTGATLPWPQEMVPVSLMVRSSTAPAPRGRLR